MRNMRTHTHTPTPPAYTHHTTAHGQAPVNPRKGNPIFIRTGQVYKMTWKPAPPHPDVVMCCGGALQLSWSPMDSGVVASGVPGRGAALVGSALWRAARVRTRPAAHSACRCCLPPRHHAD
jgi:hypothetical protein